MRRGKDRPDLGDERGAIAIIAAGMLLVSFAILALVIDLGYMHARQRALQGAVDAAALAAVQGVDEADARARACATLTVNNFEEACATLDLSPFDSSYYYVRANVNGGLVSDVRPDPPTAIRAVSVEATSTSPLFFGRLVSSMTGLSLPASGTAAAALPTLGMSVGSRLASLDPDAGVLNSLLSGLTGSTISLTALDYRALFDTRIDLLALMGQYAANVGLGPQTFAQLLGMEVPLVDLVSAAADVVAAMDDVTGSGDRALDALEAIEASLSGTGDLARLALGELLGVDAAREDQPAGAQPGFSADIPLLSLLSLAAQAGHESGRMLPLGIPISVANIAEVRADLLLGEREVNRPSIVVGSAGDSPVTIYTAQARIRLLLKINLGISLVGDLVDLPLFIFAGEGYAEVAPTDICVPTSDGPSVTVRATPGASRAEIGNISESAFRSMSTVPTASGPATVLNVANLIRITARAGPITNAGQPTILVFTREDIEIPRTRATQSGLAAGEVLNSLLSNVTIDVDLPLGLCLPLLGCVNQIIRDLLLSEGAIRAILQGILNTAIVPVSASLDDLLVLLGVGLGEMDVTVFGLDCGGRPALVL